MEKSLKTHINKNRDELDTTDINSQRRRHLIDELYSLEKYQENHPEDDHDPTPLELYCNLNPDSLACRIYEN